MKRDVCCCSLRGHVRPADRQRRPLTRSRFVKSTLVEFYATMYPLRRVICIAPRLCQIFPFYFSARDFCILRAGISFPFVTLIVTPKIGEGWRVNVDFLVHVRFWKNHTRKSSTIFFLQRGEIWREKRCRCGRDTRKQDDVPLINAMVSWNFYLWVSRGGHSHVSCLSNISDSF